jgi:hypothetical protein
VSCCSCVASDLDYYEKQTRFKDCGYAWLFVFTPTLAFVIMLVLRLDGVGIHLAVVFIPLWIFNCVTCCGAGVVVRAHS